MNRPFVSAIIAAGGRGARVGAPHPKQLLAIAGRAILERSVSAFVDHPSIDEVIVALPAALAAEPPAYLSGASKPVRIVVGGERRQDSVANAFKAAAANAEVILIHDAARPFASADLISRTIGAAAESGAAIAALQARDTVKLTGPAEAGRDRNIVHTVPRDTVWLAQTPQGFRRDVLKAALDEAARSAVEVTDEATLVERAGHPVAVVEGDASNIKITTADDLAVAEAIARGSAKPARTGRAGTGYDLHRLVEGRPLIVGGVTIPSPLGALGHSDADVVCHAVTDAILGAACLGDIGLHFPDSDPQWKGASSLDLLSRACEMLRAEGLDVGNVDVTIVLERPKIKPHIAEMRTLVARAIGIDAARVSIKGKTNEGVDAVGRGEAIAAHAIALVRSR